MRLPKNTFPLVAALIVLGAVLWIYGAMRPTKEPVSLRFHAYVGSEKLALNEMIYENPGGEGRYRIRDFQIYISNINLTGPSAEYTLPESYHLLRFDGESPYAEIRLPAIDMAEFDQIHWGIGVDPEANGTVKIVGDLDPNNRMAWNWHVGYKFILLEGRLDNGSELIPLVYHVGFDENYTQQTLPFRKDGVQQPGNVILFKVDINELFLAEGPLDMSAIPSVKFDPDDAARIASGFKSLISSGHQ